MCINRDEISHDVFMRCSNVKVSQKLPFFFYRVEKRCRLILLCMFYLQWWPQLKHNSVHGEPNSKQNLRVEDFVHQKFQQPNSSWINGNKILQYCKYSRINWIARNGLAAPKVRRIWRGIECSLQTQQASKMAVWYARENGFTQAHGFFSFVYKCHVFWLCRFLFFYTTSQIPPNVAIPFAQFLLKSFFSNINRYRYVDWVAY